jgi:hypothetical protein
VSSRPLGQFPVARTAKQCPQSLPCVLREVVLDSLGDLEARAAVECLCLHNVANLCRVEHMQHGLHEHDITRPHGVHQGRLAALLVLQI